MASNTQHPTFNAQHPIIGFDQPLSPFFVPFDQPFDLLGALTLSKMLGILSLSNSSRLRMRGTKNLNGAKDGPKKLPSTLAAKYL